MEEQSERHAVAVVTVRVVVRGVVTKGVYEQLVGWEMEEGMEKEWGQMEVVEYLQNT